jgi:Fic family protein
MTKDNIPFQLQHILDSMLNSKENVYVRGNYRNRLDIIRTEINKAIAKYDNEVLLADTSRGKKRRA